MERAELISLLHRTAVFAERGGFLFGCDPHWTEAERATAGALIAGAREGPSPEQGWLCIRTGGTGGGVKFARHDERTLGAAVRGFCAHFGLARVNAVGVLPPWHVSGLMARVRCQATGGAYLAGDWKRLEGGEFPRLPARGEWVISLVPTQLQRLLGSARSTDWLRQFRLIFLGGGPTWPSLATAAVEARLPVSLSYGMTETAAMVTAQQPAEFLAGDRSAGKPMPHARVHIDPEGRVVIEAESLFRGYFPETRAPRSFVTQDLGQTDDAGRLHLLGRADAVIITGGRKVQPSAVEAALRATGEFEDLAVLGQPDAEWGEVVVACYPTGTKTPDLARAVAGLAAHERPKRFVPVRDWPRNAQGKINRAALAALLGPGEGR